MVLVLLNVVMLLDVDVLVLYGTLLKFIKPPLLLVVFVFVLVLVLGCMADVELLAKLFKLLYPIFIFTFLFNNKDDDDDPTVPTVPPIPPIL